ncbi:MAG: ABC transporter permease [Deltaproteobacteria bacterium]|jgi:peptide/nickel transport system permease protein|nr:MAG: ABC transporter permease [Deltaproteobacteria bacterium]
MYSVKRLAYMVLVLFGISLLIFFLARVMPGDPARLALGPEATQEQVQALRHRLGLDQPLYTQYYVFVKGLLKGELGMSLVTKRDVSKDLIQRLPATLELVVAAMAIAVLAGIPLGVLSALHKDRTIDQLSRIFAFAGVSLPRFWIGIMFQIAFAYSLGLLPITGRITGDPPAHITGLYLLDSLLTRDFPAFMDSFKHILLPSITLSLSPLAQITRLIRASMIEQLRKDYTVVSRIIGMPENLNIYKYMLKNAFTATLTVIGLLFGWMIGNAFVVEQVFSWPGMARYGVNSVLRNDFNAVVGVTLVIGVGYVLINFIVDLLYGYLDPRIRLKK